MEKRLYKSRDNKIISGILGGLGEYTDVDPVVLRLLWLAITIFTGVFPGVLIYVAAMIIVPSNPKVSSQ